MPLDPEDLAYARGCFEWNDCWTECVESARYTIEDEPDPAEIAWAEAWLAKQAAQTKKAPSSGA